MSEQIEAEARAAAAAAEALTDEAVSIALAVAGCLVCERADDLAAANVADLEAAAGLDEGTRDRLRLDGPRIEAIVAGLASSTATAQNGALAFVPCMRSHGIPGWPDPDSSGHFDKSKLRQLGVSVSSICALEEGACNHLLTASGS